MDCTASLIRSERLLLFIINSLTDQNTGIWILAVELGMLAGLRRACGYPRLFISHRRAIEFSFFCTIKPMWLWRALVSPFCSLFYSWSGGRGWRKHPTSKFSKWGLAAFLWEKIASLLPGRAQLGPVTCEWLGEHTFCPLFSRSGSSSLLWQKNRREKEMGQSYCCWPAFFNQVIFSLFKNLKEILQLLPVVLLEGLFECRFIKEKIFI